MSMLLRPVSPSLPIEPLKTIAQQIEVLRNSGSFDEAEKLSKETLKQYPKNAELHFLLATILQIVDRKNEAITHANLAYELQPVHFQRQIYLARLFLEVNIYEMTFVHWKDLEVKHPNSYLVHWLGADYYDQVGEGQKALPYFIRAAELCNETENIPLLRYGRATCLMNINESKAAKEILSELLQNTELSDRALQRLVFIAKKEDYDQLLPLVESALQRSTPDSQNRADWLITLGRIQEGQKLYDQAFTSWQASRSISNKKTAALNGKTRKNTSKVHPIFSAEAFRRVAPYTHDSVLPVCIGGMPRSGTTLTEQIIGAHPRCAGVGEMARMAVLRSGMTRDYSNKNPVDALVKNAKQGELKARAEETIKVLELIGGTGHTHIVEKTPDNWRAFGYIHLVFPNAKMIHCRRHPADCFISSYQNLFSNMQPYVAKQSTFAKYYLEQEYCVTYWKTLFPKHIHEVQYEKLVTDPEGEVRKILDFLELPWDDQCLRFFEQKKTVRTFSSVQVRSAITSSSVGRWKHYEKYIGPLFEALDAAKFEYPMP